MNDFCDDEPDPPEDDELEQARLHAGVLYERIRRALALERLLVDEGWGGPDSA